MRYENYATVKNLVNQIEKHQKTLDLLETSNNTVIIEYSYGSRVYSIGVWTDCEHEYRKQAAALIDFIKDDLQNRIENLKSQLAQL